MARTMGGLYHPGSRASIRLKVYGDRDTWAGCSVRVSVRRVLDSRRPSRAVCGKDGVSDTPLTVSCRPRRRGREDTRVSGGLGSC